MNIRKIKDAISKFLFGHIDNRIALHTVINNNNILGIANIDNFEIMMRVRAYGIDGIISFNECINLIQDNIISWGYTPAHEYTIHTNEWVFFITHNITLGIAHNKIDNTFKQIKF